MAYKTQKVWFVRSVKYVYVSVNRKTKILLKQCEEAAGIYWCLSKNKENKLKPYIKETLEYGEIDEKVLKWK